MNHVHSQTNAIMHTPGADETDSVASLLDEQATPEALENATGDEILFSICVMLLMNEEPTPDRLRRYTPGRSLFEKHSQSKQLGALFQAALRDESLAAQAVTFMNTERATWSVLVDHVRRLGLTPSGDEATVEDVIHWLAAHPCGSGALHEAVRLGLQDQSRSHTPEWLDEAWQHIVQLDLIREAIEHANARNAAMLAERYVSLADDEDILGLFRQGAHIGRSAQVVFFRKVRASGLLVELAKESKTRLEPEEYCRELELEELEEIEDLALQNEYFQSCVRREIKRRV